MMKYWTIRARIVGSFAVVVALVLVMGIVAYTRLENGQKRDRPVQRHRPWAKYSSDLQTLIWENYALTQRTPCRRKSRDGEVGGAAQKQPVTRG